MMKPIDPELAKRAKATHEALQLLKQLADTCEPEGARILRRASLARACGTIQHPGQSTRAYNPDPLATGDTVLMRDRSKMPWGEVRERTFGAEIHSVERSSRSGRETLYFTFRPFNDAEYICAWGSAHYYLDGRQPDWGPVILQVK